MHRPLVLLALAAGIVFVRPAHAQTRDNTIDPGMTKAQVIEHLGPPSSVKTTDSMTYLMYPNNCKSCGMQDVVFLAKDQVVDAIFRDPKRHYTGKSSSPAAIPAAEAIKTGQQRAGQNPPSAAKPAPADTGKAAVLPTIVPKPQPVAPADSAKKADTGAPPKDTTGGKPPAA